MKRTFTKLLSVLLVACMLCSAAVPALAEGTYTAKLSSTTMTASGSITVTEGGGGTHSYQLSVALDSGKLGTDPVYPYVYDSTNTTVNVTVTVTENGDEVTELDSNYSVYVWFEDEDSNDNTITTVTGTLGTGGTITGTITLDNYSFTEGTNYNVYARVNYNDAEVDGSMEGTSFTINTTYALVLQMDTANYDSTTGIYVYDLEDTANVTVSFASVINEVVGSYSQTIPTGTMLTIWYSDDSGWSDLTFDLGSRVHLSDIYGENPTALTLSSGSFTAGKIYTMGAGLYNECGDTLATMSVQFTIPVRASIYGRTLMLDGSIGVNFYVDMTDVNNPEDYTMSFTVDGETSVVPYNAESYRTIEGTNYYRFTVYVDSTQMAETITAKLLCGDLTVDTDEYSVKTYCDKAIKDTWNAADVCTAMLNYGGYSEIYLKNADTGTANANLSTLISNWSDPVTNSWDNTKVSGYTSSVSNSLPAEIKQNSDGTYFGMTLVLDSETRIRVYFNLTEGSSATDVTFTVDGSALDIQEVQSGDTGYGTYSYYVEFKVKASSLSTTYEITVADKGTEGTLEYSALAYVNAMVVEGKTDKDELKNVCKALYFYSEAADAYTDWYQGN